MQPFNAKITQVTFILLSAALTLALSLTGMAPHGVLWSNWLSAGVITFLLWQIISRFALHGGGPVRVSGVAWPLLTVGFQYASCFLPDAPGHPLLLPLQAVALVLLLALTLSLWQHHTATLKCLLYGFGIGLIAALIPQALLWVTFYLAATYIMRCWSVRNTASVLTGIVFACWATFSGLYLFASPQAAWDHLHGYLPLVSVSWTQLGAVFAGLNGGACVLVYGLLCLLGCYLLLGCFVGSRLSIRAYYSLYYVLAYCLLGTILLFLFTPQLPASFGLLSLYVSLLIILHLAIVPTVVHEWVVVAILTAALALCAEPLLHPLF